MSDQPSVLMAQLADYLALVYHEARNVRHLIEAGFLERAGWEKVIELPRNRVKAWEVVQPLRAAARAAGSARAATVILQRRFGVDLPDLVELYSNPNWRHARCYGGNAWVQPATWILQLVDAIDQGEDVQATELLSTLGQARHNTGRLSDKISELDQLAGES